MTSPTRSETALIRPFAQIEEADVPLEGVRLWVAGEEYPAGAVVLAEDVLAVAPLSLKLPSPQEVRAAVEKTSVPPQDCGLVVLGASRSNRVSRVIVQEYLKQDAWPASLSLPRDSSDLVLGDRYGFSLLVAVVLLHDLAPSPLHPHMAGTWLARREFAVSPEREDTSFSPEELTEEIREFLNLPKGVLRFVQVLNWQNADVLSDEVRVYVEPEVLNLLLASPTDRGAIQMQVELAIQSMETVAATIAHDLSDDGKQAPSSEALSPYPAAARFFESLSRSTTLSVEDLLDVAVGEPNRLRAHLEVAFNAKAVTAQALKES